ncbi:MAG: DUF1501 domain-containing protein [Zavarzinella sp.]
MTLFNGHRRQWIQFASGLVSGLISSATVHARKSTPVKTVLVVFTGGGMSQFESWDPKPDAPAEIRGEFQSIATSTPGVRFSEHLPRTAQLAHRLCVVRSMSHDDLDHGSACYVSLTGRFHARKSSNPPILPTDFPVQGAVVKRLKPARELPFTAVHLNGPLLAPIALSAGQNAGFLGRGFDPLLIGNVLEPLPVVEGIRMRAGLPLERLESRKVLRDQLQQTAAYFADHDRRISTEQAHELLHRPAYLRAFDLRDEPARVRESYGMNRSGQACLMARRLVEAEVPWVNLFFNHGIRGQDTSTQADDYGWDTHNDIFDSLKTQLLPRFDLAFSALIDDLHHRELLEQTLVVCMGEFGRAPKVAIEANFAGNSPGRKHWGQCYSIVLAGGGVKPGFVYGSSDRMGAYPSEKPVSPPDITATMYHALGIDPTSHFDDLANRPNIVSTGTPLKELFL